MNRSLPRVLFISSANPMAGPGSIALSLVETMKETGFDVDLLTHYPVPGRQDILYVVKRTRIENLIQYLRWVWHKIRGFRNEKHMFFYDKEIHPPVSVRKVMSAIKREYDLVIIFFWQGLLSFKTVKEIYERQHALFFFLAPDFSHMSGGCHFVGDCDHYTTGCGNCPAIHSIIKKDFTFWNVRYRMDVYEEVKPIVFGNSYMSAYYDRSFLLKNARTVFGPQPINTNVFHPLDKQAVREKYAIGNQYHFLIGFGCQGLSDPRKGVDYLIDALNNWNRRLDPTERERVLLIVVGNGFSAIRDRLPFNAIDLGLVRVPQLVEFYSMSDVFLCSSIDDPGPSMVLQSLACATPVVGFEMGAVIDYVKGRGTGYCARMKDAEDLASGIDCFYRMSDDQRDKVSMECSAMVQEHYTNQALISYWLDVYDRFALERKD